MGLTLGGRELARLRIQAVSLLPAVGGYEMQFVLDLTANASTYADADAADVPRRVTIIGARAAVSATPDETQRLGFARPEEPFEVTSELRGSRTRVLHLHLHPGQLSALETLRGTGDLTFDLLLIGAGVSAQPHEQVQDSQRIEVPRSRWIDMLRAAGAGDVMLIEVPLPLASPSGHSDQVRTALLSAEAQFRAGDYTACIASCRTVIQEAGHRRHGQRHWAPQALDRLGQDRKDMTKGERESALWAILREYTHLAHHAAGEGGASDFSRADAQFVLRLTVAAVAHAEASLRPQPLLTKD